MSFRAGTRDRGRATVSASLLAVPAPGARPAVVRCVTSAGGVRHAFDDGSELTSQIRE
jgi:hypothetical protein